MNGRIMSGYIMSGRIVRYTIRYAALLLLAVSGNGFCQAGGKESKPGKRWMVGISYEANLTGSRFRYSPSNRWIKQLRTGEQVSRYGFSAGLNASYRLNARFAIDAGVLFADRGFRTGEKTLTWVSPGADYPFKSKTKTAFHYIELPLKLCYKFRIGSSNIYAFAGVSWNNFISKKTTVITYYENGDKDKSERRISYGYRQNTCSALIGFGINIAVSRRLLFNLEPVYRQDFSSITADKQAREYLYALGINTRLFLKPKKAK
jgi:hypothetical protein